jgi:RNA polymerase sigma-70 factor (ECF subfamily)
MKVLANDDVEVVKKLREGNAEVLEAIYRNNEVAFINWARSHYTVDNNQAKDIFQLAVIALYQNAREQRLQQLTCSVKTYLFSIGKRLLLRLKMREVKIDTFSYEGTEALEIPDEVYVNLVDTQKVHAVLDQVGEPCKSILEKFYFDGLSMQEIAKDSHYKSEGVIRKKKHQCMQRLKEIIKDKHYTITDFLEL